MLKEIENWNKEKEDGINQRREVKGRIRAQEEAILEEERKRLAAAHALAKAQAEKHAEEMGLPKPVDFPPPVLPDSSLIKSKADKEETDSDDEYKDIDIKRKLKEFKKDHQNELFPVEIINEAVRWRLNQNDCQNRGYVLDGYPRSFTESNGVFFVQNPKPEPKFIIDEATGEKVPAPEEMDEEALKEFLKPKFQKNIYPDSVILLRGSKDLISSRLEKFLPGKTPEETKTWHWSPEEQERRYSIWYGNNAIANYRDGDRPPMSRFFQENNTELFEVDCDGENFEMFESMRIYIERDGRPYNYLKSVAELNKKREQQLHEEESQWRDGLRKEQEVKDR
jgi:adenylate kinase family enzyme